MIYLCNDPKRGFCGKACLYVDDYLKKLVYQADHISRVLFL